MQTNKKNETLTSSIRTKAKKSTRIFNKVFHAKKCPTFPGNPVHGLCPAQPEIIVSSPGTSQPAGITGLIRAAKGTTEKNLPTTGFIPPRFMALAAMLMSFAVILINLLISNITTLSQVVPRIARLFADLAGGHAVEKISETEIERRGITVRQRDRRFLGLSALEIIAIEAAFIMVALAFILADRAELTLQSVLIYIIGGVISVVFHDFVHRWFATLHGHDADTQFWWLGTEIVFLTAWLYGNAFARSYRNLVKRQGREDEREMGIEMVAGPCVSIILMVLFLALIPAGGIWAVAGGGEFFDQPHDRSLKPDADRDHGWGGSMEVEPWRIPGFVCPDGSLLFLHVNHCLTTIDDKPRSR